MVTTTPARGARPAAVSASTVFAIALAIVAGLIFAWLFKMVLLDKKPAAPPKDDTIDVTVAARNIYDKMEVSPIQVKHVRWPKAQYDALVRRVGKEPLIGNQPVGRTTKHMVRAETPFFEEDLYDLNYPEPLSKFIRQGYRPVEVTLPPRAALVQVGDYVDLYCTMSNDALGVGGNGTAEIAKAAKVVARFGTTRPYAQPPGGPDAPRQYTLEVTPYRAALIELARTVGGKFSMGAVPSSGSESDNATAPPGNDPTDPQEQRAGPLNGDDLAALFNIQPKPEKPGPWVIEKYIGIQDAGRSSYEYVPPSKTFPAGNGGSPAAGKPSAQNSVRPASDTSLAMSGPRKSTTSFAARSGNSLAGFKAPNDPDKPAGCPTCGKK